MISYKLMGRNAGIVLIGDYLTLRRLHEVVHYVNEKSRLVDDKEGWFINLAYDLRKAFEGQREKIKAPQGYPEVGKRFGVEIIWPVILMQARLLRASLGFIPNGSTEQAAVFDLEAAIENAIREDFVSDAEIILTLWRRLSPEYRGFMEMLNSRAAMFCSWRSEERRKKFGSLLQTIDLMYPTMSELYRKKGVDHGMIDHREFAKYENVEWKNPLWEDEET